MKVKERDVNHCEACQGSGYYDEYYIDCWMEVQRVQSTCTACRGLGFTISKRLKKKLKRYV